MDDLSKDEPKGNLRLIFTEPCSLLLRKNEAFLKAEAKCTGGENRGRLGPLKLKESKCNEVYYVHRLF